MRARLLTEVTVAEYLEAEGDAETRREYVYGEVFALAGGSVTHNVIGANVVRLLGNAAGSECRACGSDMKLRVEEQLFYYPDGVVVCEAPADDFYETSPCVVVEVISPSTARKDRLEKRFAYLALASLQLYLMIDSRRREVIGYYRRAQGWEERLFAESEAVPVPCVGSSLNFGELLRQDKRIKTVTTYKKRGTDDKTQDGHGRRRQGRLHRRGSPHGRRLGRSDRA